MMHFDDLPVELILKIFSYLSQLALATVAEVSERWKTLALDPSLWSEVHISLWDRLSAQQLCSSCPMLELLDLNSDHIRHRSTWECLESFQRLTCLSLSQISTSALLHLSKACPRLQSLKISSVRNDNNVTVAQALQAFHKLRMLSVDGDCGTGWLDSRFRTPRELECFDVQQLQMDEIQIGHLLQRCREKLEHVTISSRTLTPNALKLLHDYQKLESVAIYGGCAGDMLLKMLFTLPKLVRVEMNVVGEARDAVGQLHKVVDLMDKSAALGSCSVDTALPRWQRTI
ncbi:hypothetical protein HPB49_024745 [Dermacentor silvarum]|uniref:Uncharacterized protein n=1 Tax=Dermacentor silvarum TaxID=543639 RepID=A0ACB8D8W8_DERSI|nr:hypothetical protein HPB49_024745 [Dermacentor silvarum]